MRSLAHVVVTLATVLALALAPAPALGQQTETEIASKEPGASAELVYSGLSGPVDIAFGDDGTLYYAAFEAGELRAVRGQGQEEALWSAPDLQLGGERGFVGLAIGPDDAFYVFYQTNKSGTVVSRLSRVVDGQETVLLDDIRSEKLHNSGRIAFGPDGLMYVSVGDAVMDTAGRHRSVHAHDPTVLNGKVLRLTADGLPAPGNPWGNEVWTKGHRNVYGLAVSPGGVVLATENGPESWDEVNILAAGKDYGWPTCTGACDDDAYADPLFAYESTIAPTGAVWYEGHFYFTDFNKGTLHRARYHENGTWTDERVLKFTTPRILDVAVGPGGLYLATWDSVWKVVPTDPASGWDSTSAPTPATPTGTQVVPDDPTPTTGPLATDESTGGGEAAAGRGIPGPGPAALVLASGLAIGLVLLGERRRSRGKGL